MKVEFQDGTSCYLRPVIANRFPASVMNLAARILLLKKDMNNRMKVRSCELQGVIKSPGFL